MNRIVLALVRLESPCPPMFRDEQTVPVERPAERTALSLSPIGDQVDDSTDSGGSQNPVRPHDLGTAAGSAILQGFFSKILLGENAQAVHAGLSRYRDTDLPAHHGTTVVTFPNVHTEVDIDGHVSAGKRLKLTAAGESVYTSDDDLTAPKGIGKLLPSRHHDLNTCVWLQTGDKSLGHIDL